MENITKVCSNCKVKKSYDNFNLRKSTKDGLQYWCKQCVKKNYQENADVIAEYHKKYRQENPGRLREYHKKWYQENTEIRREYVKKWHQENPGYVKKWRQQNPEYTREYEKNRRKSDPIYKMIGNIRKRISKYCREIKLNKTKKTKEILGLNLAGFKSYMESKFQEGMTWENYGQWHVDHIKPLSLATTEQEIIELNHYTNLQPLWAAENLKKSNKYEESH